MWYVAYTLPKHEEIVQVKMENLGFEVYYPFIPEGFPPRERPLFPRYLLFRPKVLNLSPETVCTIKGVIRLLGYNNNETPLSDSVVRSIKERVEQIRYHGGVFVLRPGDKVKIQSGVFEGLEGIFLGLRDSRERAKVLLKLMRCRDVPVELPVEAIIGKVKLPRRTRGKGRVIKNIVSQR